MGGCSLWKETGEISFLKSHFCFIKEEGFGGSLFNEFQMLQSSTEKNEILKNTQGVRVPLPMLPPDPRS